MFIQFITDGNEIDRATRVAKCAHSGKKNLMGGKIEIFLAQLFQTNAMAQQTAAIINALKPATAAVAG